MQNPSDLGYYSGTTTTASRSGLHAKVFGLLAFSMVFTAIGGFVGMQAPGLAFPAMIGVLILSFAIGFAREKSPLNLILLYTLTALAGVGLGGMISIYIGAGMGNAVIQAGATTAALTFGISIYAWTTKRDFSGMGTYLFFGVLALIVASLVGIFLQSTMLSLIIGLAGSVIFSLFLLYEVQQLKFMEDTFGNAIIMTVGIYLSILNLFTSLLSVFGTLGGSDD